MWVVAGEVKMSREEWEKEHEEEVRWGMYAIHGWRYEATYEEYCAEFDRQKKEMYEMIDSVAQIRAKLMTMPYGVEWEEEYDIYSDVYKSAYGYRPHDTELFKSAGITSEMREAVFKEMELARQTA